MRGGFKCCTPTQTSISRLLSGADVPLQTTVQQKTQSSTGPKLNELPLICLIVIHETAPKKKGPPNRWARAKSKPPFFISSCTERRPPAAAVRSFSPSRHWQQTSEGAVQPSGERSRYCAASALQAGRRSPLLSSPAFAAAAASLCGSARELGFDSGLGQGSVGGGGGAAQEDGKE